MDRIPLGTQSFITVILVTNAAGEDVAAVGKMADGSVIVATAGTELATRLKTHGRTAGAKTRQEAGREMLLAATPNYAVTLTTGSASDDKPAPEEQPLIQPITQDPPAPPHAEPPPVLPTKMTEEGDQVDKNELPAV
uniref:Uncharacterized protein n=1 Tax=viral metagenome TaxID=1070528 RepID=A0A2V0R9I6_9ZZZZ